VRRSEYDSSESYWASAGLRNQSCSWPAHRNTVATSAVLEDPKRTDSGEDSDGRKGDNAQSGDDPRRRLFDSSDAEPDEL
jgi:hypothetical protein